MMNMKVYSSPIGVKFDPEQGNGCLTIKLRGLDLSSLGPTEVFMDENQERRPTGSIFTELAYIFTFQRPVSHY